MKRFLLVSAMSLGLSHAETSLPVPRAAVSKSEAGSSMVPGAQAIYLLNEGGGTTLHDTSGNGADSTQWGNTKHAFPGPTWVSQGLAFTNKRFNQSVTLPPKACDGARTIEIWFSAYADAAVSYNGNGGEFGMMLAGSSWDYVGLDWTSLGAVAQGRGSVPTSGPVDLTSGSSSVAWVGGSPSVMYVNGNKPIAYAYKGSQLSFAGSQFCTLGTWSNYQQGFYGQIYAVITYPVALTADQISQNESYMRRIMSSRGLSTVKADYSKGALLFKGDSIMHGQGVGYDLSKTIAPLVARKLNWMGAVYSFGYSGELLDTGMMKDLRSYLLPTLKRYTQGVAPILILEGGTNDIHDNYSSAALMADIKIACSEVHEIGGKCVVVSPTKNGIDKPGQNLVGETFDAALIAEWHTKGASIDAVADVGGDPIMGNLYANTQWFASDQVHPSAAGNAIMADRIALAVDYALGNHGTPYTLTVTVPYQTLNLLNAGTNEQIIDLIRLGPGQAVTGITGIVTLPYAGHGLTSASFAIGSLKKPVSRFEASLTTAGTYDLGPLSSKSTGGTVQVKMTSKGSNLNELTSGNIDFKITIEQGH